jgi:hypothetical protein
MSQVSGKTDAKATVVKDGHGAGQVVEAVMGEELGDGLTDCDRGFVGPAVRDAGVGPRRVGPDITKPLVERDEQSALGENRCRHSASGCPPRSSAMTVSTS